MMMIDYMACMMLVVLLCHFTSFTLRCCRCSHPLVFLGVCVYEC